MYKFSKEHYAKLLPYKKTGVSLERCIQERRSHREYRKDPVKFQELSNLLSAALHCTDLDDIQIFVTCKMVESMEPGLYYFDHGDKVLHQVGVGKKYQGLLYENGLKQDQIYDAAMVIVLCGVYEGEETLEFCMKIGMITQNINLQCPAHDLGTVVIGAFSDSGIAKSIGAGKNVNPLILLPIGRRKPKKI